MKKKLLLLVALAYSVIGVWARGINVYPTTIKGVNGYAIYGSGDTWTSGDLNALLSGEYDGDVYLDNVLVSGESLSNLLANLTTAEAIKLGGSSHELLNLDDVHAIENFAQAKYIDMDKTEFADGVKAGDIKSKAQYISLPYNVSVKDMQAMGPNNQNLLAAASVNQENASEFTGFSFKKAGEIWNICQLNMVDGILPGTHAWDDGNNMSKLTFGGILDDRDVATQPQDINHSFATANGIYAFNNGCTYQPAHVGYQAATHYNNDISVSPWKGNQSVELDFTLAQFDNIGDLAVVSDHVTKLALPTGDYFTVIPSYMFANLMYLEEIDVPNNIVTIGDCAFANGNNTSSLKHIKIGNGIKTIGNAAFAVREQTNFTVETIEFAAGISDVKVLSSAFNNLLGIKHLVLPEGIVSLGECCFLRATTLESVRFPSTLEYIGKSCFQQTGLHKLTIPKGVKVIDQAAFGLCSITDVYLMAETLDEIPYIYGQNFNILSNEDKSSFGSNSFSANNTSPNNTEQADYALKNTEKAEEDYRFSCEGRTVACLHYNEKLRDFIDYNPFYVEGQQTVKPKGDAIVSDPKTYYEQKYLTDTYYLVDANGKTLPICNAGDYIRCNWASYYKGTDGTEFSHDDGSVVVPGYHVSECGSLQYGDYYDRETGLLNENFNYSTEVNGESYLYKVLTKEAWRQFVFKRGDAQDDKIVLDKEYQNIWYTMCFPFGLTDEQLEAAFNAKYNIADFSAVEIKTETKSKKVYDKENDEWVDASYNDKTLILHFNTIAKAKYMDTNYDEYTRVEGSKVTHTTGDGVPYTAYTYKDKDDNTYENLNGTFSTKAYALNGDIANGVKFIDGYLAWPGHPYMIHPNIGTSEGAPGVACHLVGLQFYPLGKDNINKYSELCEVNARTIDLGTGKGYTGTIVNADNETDYNFDQKAYGVNYEGQTYTFIGNCDAYTEDAPAYPSMDNRPETPDYLTKIEAPEVVENPYPGLVDPAEKYSDEFVNFYNKKKGEGWAQDENNQWYSYDIFWGTYLAEKNNVNEEFNYYNDANQGWAYWDDAANDLTNYLGTVYVSESKFNELVTLCKNYPTDVATYNEALNSSEYAAYMAYLDAYATYQDAYNAYIAEHPGATSEDIANYNATVDPTNTQLKNDYDAAMTQWEADYQAEVEQWKENIENYKVQIPLNSYFLSRRKSEYYTHYFRNVAAKNAWNQYTAIVNPNQAALEGIETEIGGVVTDGGAKAFNFLIDKPFSPINVTNDSETTAIEKIVEEAKSKGEKVEYMNVVYSIDGKVMSRDAQSLSGLPTGIYIVNGKKYYVK